MLNRIKSIVSRIYEASFSRSMFRLDRKEREAVLAAFPEPRDDVERSFFQYRCHMQSASRLLRVLQSVLAYPAFLFLLLKSGKAPEEAEKTDTAVYISYGIGENIIPDSLAEGFARIVTVTDTPLYFTKRERAWFLPVWKRYWRYPYFLLKCYTKMGVYAALARLHRPRALIVYSEFSFTGSLLTAYCEHVGLEHINVLHGEKLLNIRDAFVRYHRFYVWDETHRAVFAQMRAEPAQFIVEAPPMLRLRLPPEEPRCFDLTYYAGALTEHQLERLQRCFSHLRQQGLRICVRVHPRFGDLASAKARLEGCFFEDGSEVPLELSLARTGACCGIISTVLHQAHQCGKQIVIDDVSDPEKFSLAKDLGYQMLEVSHRLLSELILEVK